MTGLPPQAIRDFTACLSKERSKFRAYYNRASCYRKLGDTERALADLQAAVHVRGGGDLRVSLD